MSDCRLRELEGNVPIRCLALLGKGGYSKVYLTESTRFGRAAAKVYDPSVPPSLPARESEVLRALQGNEHVVKLLHGPVTDGDCVFLLEEACEDRVVLPVGKGEALQIVVAVARALAPLHARGGYHADVCLSNVLAAGGVFKLADFGCARLAHHAPPDEPIGQIRAPEIIGGGQYSPAVDVFALGVVFAQLMLGHEWLTREPIISRRAEIDGTHWPLIESMLTEDPDSRPSIARVLSRLEAS